MAISATVVVTNGTNFPATGGGQIRISGTHGGNNVDLLNVFPPNRTLQPGQSVRVSSNTGTALRHNLAGVESWQITLAVGQYFFPSVDSRCVGPTSTNIVFR
jgi:hypothetical protein